MLGSNSGLVKNRLSLVPIVVGSQSWATLIHTQRWPKWGGTLFWNLARKYVGDLRGDLRCRGARWMESRTLGSCYIILARKLIEVLTSNLSAKGSRGLCG